MGTYVLFFMLYGSFTRTSINTSSITMDFTTSQQCEVARSQLNSLVTDKWSSFSFCAQK